MRSPLQAVIWEVWARKRMAIFLAFVLTGAAYLSSAFLPNSLLVELLNMHLAAGVVILLIATCSYAELNAQTDTSGFPPRLFVLPVSTFRLVAVPIVMGIAIVELMYALWQRFVFKPDEQTIDLAFLLGTYIVLHQTILWTLHGLKSLRLVVLGFVAISLIASPIFRMNGASAASFNAVLSGFAMSGFLTSWVYVSRQRSGGGLNRDWVKSWSERSSGRLRRRDKVFDSPQSAQFWFEWRRCGSVFPILVGALLVTVIGPLSWYTRATGTDSLRILIATVAMPVVLALPIGKAFSKPDFWSKDLAVPGVVAVRPMTSHDIVAVKMKVAAASAAIAWLLVLMFLATWLPLWANHDSIAMVRGLLWEIHGHSVLPQYAMAVLGTLAMIVLTWRFLVAGMWLGLSGNDKLFALSAIPYVVVPLFILPMILITAQTNQSFLTWVRTHANFLVTVFVWSAAAAVCTKFWLAAISWRAIASAYVRRYLPLWFVGTVVLITFAILLSNVLGFFIPADPYRLRNLMILVALLVFPVARPGAAAAALERNRHRT